MKKILALIIIPSISFAGKIGENYFGIELGSTKFDLDTSWTTGSVSSGANGFSYGLKGNYNLYENSEYNYGVDIHASFFSGSGDEKVNDSDGDSWNFDTDLSRFGIGFRTHYSFDNIKIFADLGFLDMDVENKVTVTTGGGTNEGKVNNDGSKFLYGFGVEFSFSEKFVFQPSILFSESPDYKETIATRNINIPGNDLFVYTFPLSYNLSEKIDITASYQSIDLDEYKTVDYSSKSDFSIWSLGLDYKF